MNISLVDAAFKIITSQQILVNVVSKRVRQLSAGQRPMIDTGARMGYSDIALSEIIAGKLTWEPAPSDKVTPPPAKKGK